ncbi:hypothetical protein [Immundisolibacter sp.]
MNKEIYVQLTWWNGDYDEYSPVILTNADIETITDIIEQVKEKYPGNYMTDDVWDELEAKGFKVEIIKPFIFRNF